MWIGATIANQEELERDGPKLRALPVAVRFISYEPALGPLDFCGLWVPYTDIRVHENILEGIHWVIGGGESGPRARPADPDWFRSARDQCHAVGSKFFMKQMGGARDKRGNLEHLPEDLRVREFPNSTTGECE